MRKMLLIDPDKCVDCRICVMVCSLNKTGSCNPVRSRISIARWEEGKLAVPIMCLQCDDPPCVPCCPVNALTKDEETGVVLHNQQVCIGCKMCIMVCPFGGPSFDPIEHKVIKCDACEGNPQCADVCPTGAVQYIRSDRSAAVRRRGAMEKFRRSIGVLNRDSFGGKES